MIKLSNIIFLEQNDAHNIGPIDAEFPNSLKSLSREDKIYFDLLSFSIVALVSGSFSSNDTAIYSDSHMVRRPFLYHVVLNDIADFYAVFLLPLDEKNLFAKKILIDSSLSKAKSLICLVDSDRFEKLRLVLEGLLKNGAEYFFLDGEVRLNLANHSLIGAYLSSFDKAPFFLYEGTNFGSTKIDKIDSLIFTKHIHI
jgi:hypothetical protein